jgi:translocation and assembly module TamB
MRIFKFIFSFIFKTIFIFSLILLVLFVILQASFVKNKITKYLCQKVEQECALEISYNKASGFLPLSLAIHNIRIGKGEEGLATVEKASLAVSPSINWADLKNHILPIKFEIIGLSPIDLESHVKIDLNGALLFENNQIKDLGGRIESQGAFVSGSTSFQYLQNQILFPDILIENNGSLSASNALRGSLELSLENYMVNGSIEGGLQEIPLLKIVCGIAPEGKQQVNLEASFINSSLTESFPLFPYIQTVSFDAVHNRQNGAFPFSLSINKDLSTDFESSITGFLDTGSNQIVLGIDEWKGWFLSKNFSLNQAIAIPFSKGSAVFQATLPSFQLSYDKAIINGSMKISDKKLSGSLHAAEIPLPTVEGILTERISGLKPLLQTGTASLELELSGNLEESFKEGSFKISLKEIGFREAPLQHLPQMEVLAEGGFTEKGLHLSAELLGLSENPVKLSGEIPLQRPFSELKTTIAANLKIAPLINLFLNDSVRIGGEVDLALDVTGSLDNPAFSGRVDLRKGTYEDLDLGVFVKNISGKIEGEGNRLILKALAGVDSSVGRLSGTGFIELDPKTLFPFEIALKVQNGILLQLDLAEAVGSGNMVFSGNKEKGLLKGELEVTSAHITIPEKTPKRLIVPLDITYINQPIDNKAISIKDVKKETWPVELDLKLRIPGNTLATGRNLKSEWKGEIALSGLSDNPSLNGFLKVVKAEYEFDDKIFKAKEGTITFNGDLEKKSTIYVVSGLNFPEVKIDAILKGALVDPELTFRSTPPLSQKEILSWILFNEAVSEISPLQAVQLSQTLLSLGGDDRTDVLGNIRKSLGVDRLDIKSTETEEGNELTVRVGKYLSRVFFVSINKNITAETNELAIEAELAKNVKAQVEIDDDAQGTLILKWQKDY